MFHRARNPESNPLDDVISEGKFVSVVRPDAHVTGTVDALISLTRQCVSASPSHRPGMRDVLSALAALSTKGEGSLAPPGPGVSETYDHLQVSCNLRFRLYFLECVSVC